ncbi:hypothetical protein [Streptomyces sp. NPDC087294]|uniref:hypothetical protein n=1 Tax=Streptomyces sp. NPDC087294 TaxID=3365777 RepID=UPI003823584A
MTAALPSRAWTVTISTPAGRPVLACSTCSLPTPISRGTGAAEVRQHLAAHLKEPQLPPYLRTCQCRERGCAWHRLRVPCSGPLRLVLIRADCGRTWRLADVCHACATAIPHAAVVSEPSYRTASAPASPPLELADPAEEPDEWVEAP